MHLPALYHNNNSRLYINEKVLTDRRPDMNPQAGEQNAAPSPSMVTLPDAQRRREVKWRWLLDQAGMEVVDIRKFTKNDDSVIIAKRRLQDQWR